MSKCKIDAEQVAAIRAAYLQKNGGAGVTTLAARYSVSTTVIYSALKGTHPAAPGLPDICGMRGSSFSDRLRPTRKPHSSSRCICEYASVCPIHPDKADDQ